MKTVVFFDVDGTLLKGNINASILRRVYATGHASPVLILRALFWYALWVLGLYRNLSVLAEKGARELRGIKETTLQKILDDAFDEYIKPKIYKEAEEIIITHQKKGHLVILLSSSYEPFVRKVAVFMGISDVIATRLETKNGIYTGRIAGEVVGGNKHAIVSEYQKNHSPVESYAYTDHDQDIPMLELVTHPVATNPTPRLKSFARKASWSVLMFSKTYEGAYPAY